MININTKPHIVLSGNCYCVYFDDLEGALNIGDSVTHDNDEYVVTGETPTRYFLDKIFNKSPT